MATKKIPELDQYVFDRGKWQESFGSAFRHALGRWMVTPPDDLLKLNRSAETIGSFLQESGDPDRGDPNRQLLLQQTAAGLETNLAIVLSRIAHKWYRDHLNHAVRVAMTANALLTTCYEGRGPIPQIRVPLVGASLMHDFGYYLSRFNDTVQLLGDSLGKLYSLSKGAVGHLHILDYSELCKEWFRLRAILPESKVIDSPFREAVSYSVEHNILSAIEAKRILGWQGDDANTLQVAITRHDPGYECDVRDLTGGDLNRANLCSVILILADELQDWGRENWGDLDVGFASLKRLQIERDYVGAEYHLRPNASTAVLGLAVGKYRSLKRAKPLGISNIEIQQPIYPELQCSGRELLYLIRMAALQSFGNDLKRAKAFVKSRDDLPTLRTVLFDRPESMPKVKSELARTFYIIGTQHDFAYLCLPLQEDTGDDKVSSVSVEWIADRQDWHVAFEFRKQGTRTTRSLRQEVGGERVESILEVALMEDCIRFVDCIRDRLIAVWSESAQGTADPIIQALLEIAERSDQRDRIVVQ